MYFIVGRVAVQDEQATGDVVDDDVLEGDSEARRSVIDSHFKNCGTV